jgi:hypothetical protein
MIPAREIKEGGLYRHYKGDLYKVIKIAYDTEGKVLTSPADVDDEIKLVVYRSVKPNAALGEDVWWVRPYRMFNETILINGVEEMRFSEVDDCF